ncbi:MAG: carboxypeptidase regulatory-like domain-containing protein [Gemmatimonadaceae bacterium]|nr:carboxypeptidase regulatory-like domain-containing protein [Gemmatimonadaceae bacterium]
MRRHPATRWLPTALAALLGVSSVHAQALVTGTLRDSVHGRPFANATVELVPAHAPWMSGFTTRSDSSGRFQIAEVPAGKYLFGFLHPRLDSLGMDQVTRTIDVKPAQSRVTADLALPSARTLAAMLCHTRRDNAGVLLGRVYDARDGHPVTSGTLLVRWGELSVGDSGLRNDAAQRTVSLGGDGRFMACNVPTDAPLLVQAVAGNIADPAWVTPRSTSGLIELTFAYDTPLLRRDLYVAPQAPDSSIATDTTGTRRRRGTARLVGHIIADDGTPVAGARVVVREAGAEFVTDTSGSFRVTGLPLGTHTVEVIALGYTPMRTAVDLRPGTDAVAMFHPSRRVQALEEVTVRDAADHTGFALRRRKGNGFFLDANAIEKSGQLTLPMLLVSAPMLRMTGRNGSIRGRGRCEPTYFVDGQPLLMPGDDLPVVRDIGGIEVYSNAAAAPPQFTGPNREYRPDANGRDRGAASLNAFCATIVIWSKAYVR